jgi:hypothetical protein
MHTTVEQLCSTIGGGPGGLNKLANLDLPLKLAYRFGRLLRSAREAAKDVEKLREGLFEKYGEPILDPEGNPTDGKQIKKEHEEQFTEEVKAYMATDRQIWYEPVAMAEFEATGVRLSPADMNVLAPFIEGAEVEEEAE